MRRSVAARQPAILLALAAAVGCAAGSTAAGGRGAAASATTPAAPARRITRVPDANAIALLLTSHNADVAAARLAPTRAGLRDVTLLARNMITDHSTMATQLSRIAASAGISPREDEVGRLLRDAAAARRDTLRGLSGRAFDSTYVDTELRFHRDLLVAIDEVILPSARNATFRDYVVAIRPAIARHLALAEEVWAAVTDAR